MTHELKIQKQWADAKLAGEKPFEIRRNDRGFQKGDTVRYTVIDPKTGERWSDVAGGVGNHPLENCDFEITYVREGADGLEKGYCVYADQPVPKAKPPVPDTPDARPVCSSALAHARDGSAFMCSHLATDRVHCWAERGKCKNQEPAKNPEIGFETLHPSP